MKQLEPGAVLCAVDAEQRYLSLCLSNDMVEGDIKFESLKYSGNKLPNEQFLKDAIS
ncbi:MAG: hypothetical protein AAGF06_06400 [Pseudomonadota bacterium]